MADDEEEYLTPEEIGERGVPLATIRSVEKRIIDGRPRLVLYFAGQTKGLPLTKDLADIITAELGHHPLVDEFFSGEGLLH